MSKPISETSKHRKLVEGWRSGKLTVIKFSHSARIPCGDLRHYWVCKCDCGKKTLSDTCNLRNRTTKSCGCSKLELSDKEHGFARRGNMHPVYRAWLEMIRRCKDLNRPGWRDYGGRGIKVCRKWMKFQSFQKDMGPSWKAGLSLGRKNNNGNYCKRNCRWEDRFEQNNNTRRNKLIRAKGTCLTVGQWAKRLNVPYSMLMWRFQDGWEHERIVNQPSRKHANI